MITKHKAGVVSLAELRLVDGITIITNPAIPIITVQVIVQY